MDKNERRANLKRFRDGKVDYLISTDLAARGLDLEHVGRVINFHLPQQIENYLHRAGRTARAGRAGVVINLVTERDSRLIATLEGKKSVTGEQRIKSLEKKHIQQPTENHAKKSAYNPKAKPKFKPKPKPTRLVEEKPTGRYKAVPKKLRGK